ncbi:MAG: polysaccharide deacetylase family protein [Bacteroidia bacterium]
MFKHTIPSIFPLIAPNVTWKVKTSDKVLYLTFDDGPHPTITPLVLSILDEYNAKATFFCVGENVTKYPDTFNQIIRKGHAVGNHTYNHIKGWQSTNEVYFDNIKKANEVIQSNLFRPPYGLIKPSQIKMLKHDYRIVMWSILTRDYDKNLNPHIALKHLNKLTKPGDVIVFHDSKKAEQNMLIILKGMLQHFNQLNYSFKAL